MPQNEALFYLCLILSKDYIRLPLSYGLRVAILYPVNTPSAKVNSMNVIIIQTPILVCPIAVSMPVLTACTFKGLLNWMLSNYWTIYTPATQ